MSTGDFMIFKYKNHSKFTTRIFDPTACEKEEAFWAKPKNGAANDNRQAFNVKPKNVAVDSYKEEDYDVVEVVPEDQAAQFTLKRKRAQRSPSDERLDNPRRTGSTGESYTAPLKSQRRPVSQEELNRAIDRSEAFRSANPFTTLVMRDSYCYHHFQLNLPFGFARQHLPRTNTKMTLWDPNGRSWPVAYLYYRRRAGMRSGWNRFSYENNLERGDVCIFELIRPDEMRVHIYRVVEKITPLIRFNPRLRC
ncbi:hypothetical protein J5N97_027898 [Dioscorea zingiberensis]|uniref:TF-B3 domain-containing protein n=1 Tax=Dioscorea zingiberensis TaxID=325984 RepID=A0A9D5H4E6_9LILI|nr:hypothetical protein J5N97_027898 [Dioscorea zingiberensis]